MKNLLLLFGLLAGISAMAQNVNIPDPNFKNALLTHSPVIDTNSDGEIQTAEAQSFTGTINIMNKNIYNLTGIEAFVNMKELWVSNNHLSSLNTNQNTALETLYCNNNLLTGLNVNNNPNLAFLDCSNNQLTTLDITHNLNLSYLACHSNHLTQLDISKNAVLDYLNCQNNYITELDASNCLNLTMLHCQYNQLTTLNVSGLLYLTGLQCFHNSLTQIDITSSPALSGLICFENQLTALNLSNNPELKVLECSHNLITELNLSNNIKLSFVSANDNQLTSFNIANGNNNLFMDPNEPNYPYNGLIVDNNNNLTCIKVDNPAYSNANWTDPLRFKKPAGAIWGTCTATLNVNDVQQKESFKIYPNPAQDFITIQDSKKQNETLKYEILDGSGRLLKKGKALFNGKINVSSLQKGTYILQIQSENEPKYSVKLIKK